MVITVIKKMSVCQMCGDKGDVKCLVYCNWCRVSAEHRYCMNNLLRKGDKTFVWACEECTPRDTNTTLIRSSRVKQAVETKLSRIKMQKKTIASKVSIQSCNDQEQPTFDYSCTGEGTKRIPPFSHSIENEELKRCKRRLKLEDGNSDEEYKPVNFNAVDHPQLEPGVGFHHEMSFSNANNYTPALPNADPIWRGSFNITNNGTTNCIGLTAHLSSKACLKVQDAVKTLPIQLNVAIFPRLKVWPQTFRISPPGDDNIALYIFPEHERDEKFFDGLMNDIIIQDQALKAVIDDVELLMFSSCELPPENWRFCSKYYLWGVFKPSKKKKKKYFPTLYS